MDLKGQLKEILTKEAGKLVPDNGVQVIIDSPTQESHGDYSSNLAMILAKKLGKNPMELAQQLAAELKTQNSKLKTIERIEVARPGFINFWINEEELLSSLKQSSNEVIEQFSTNLSGQKIFVEYAHPNTHKEMHIGHMRTLITGEALSRLFEASGATVFRANYQGDIGPHVAKALYGVQKLMEERKLALSEVEGWSNKDKAHFLGEGYVKGNQDYEEHKEVMDAINTELYSFINRHSGKEPFDFAQGKLRDDSRIGSWTSRRSLNGGQDDADKNWSKLYLITRKWSLDYYEEFYTRFYTHFDQLFFESAVAEAGKKIVEEHIGSVFTEENGAVIFPGEKYGLHTRVFITQAGNPTYEGKEMGNAFAEYKAFPFDLKLHVVASEQAGYFQVVFKALDLIDPQKFEAKEHHLSMGMVTLTDRKMSSRTGDVLTVDWLIDQVRERVEQLAKEGKIESEKIDETIEMITIGAIKYSVLKGGTGQNVAFDIEKSVSLEGNSGPYLQYTYARTRSVLGKWQMANGKWENGNQKLAVDHELEKEELQLLRKLYQFDAIVTEAAEKYAPNVLATYLFELAQTFNLFYQKHKVLGSSEEALRLRLTAAVGDTLKKGLDLLGIKAPEKM